MTRNVRARYEQGVLRPLDDVDLPEGATVLLVIRPDGWDEELGELLGRVRERTRGMAPEEIETEITRASEDVRLGRLGQA